MTDRPASMPAIPPADPPIEPVSAARGRLLPSGFYVVAPTHAETLAYQRRAGHLPSVHRGECSRCGLRIWVSGLGVASHRRACPGTRGPVARHYVRIDRADGSRTYRGPWARSHADREAAAWRATFPGYRVVVMPAGEVAADVRTWERVTRGQVDRYHPGGQAS